ncbi:hypothetical protein B0T11DRAFT_60891 [Plectosphaerella cucumerina]|uniref:Uncharacterized protein n=1 Tax=Plectosphaerella cucumerina TaxID=40658 RepID=A0A8K0TP43_9PEZI|nr:hypothetical protein B0T11DRAFT_60891 [Plectosphaerella cucumerina]
MKTLLFAPMLLSVALGRTLNLNAAEKAPAPERRPLAHYLDKISSKDGLTHIDIPCSTGETVGCFKQLCETSRAATPDFDCGRIFSNSPSLDRAHDDRSHGTKPYGKVRLDQCEPWNPELDNKCFNQLCKVVDARWPHQHMCALGHRQHKTTPSHDSSYKGRPLPHKAKDYKRSVSNEDTSESADEEPVEPDTDVETDTTVEPVTIVHPPTVQPATAKPAGVQPATTRTSRDPLRSWSLDRLEKKIKKQYMLVKKLRKEYRKLTGDDAGKNHSGALARAEKKYLRLESLRKKKMGYLESKMKLKIKAQKSKANTKAKSKMQRLKLSPKKKPKKADPKEDVKVEEVAEAKEEPADNKDFEKPNKDSKKTSKKVSNPNLKPADEEAEEEKKPGEEEKVAEEEVIEEEAPAKAPKKDKAPTKKEASKKEEPEEALKKEEAPEKEEATKKEEASSKAEVPKKVEEPKTDDQKESKPAAVDDRKEGGPEEQLEIKRIKKGGNTSNSSDGSGEGDGMEEEIHFTLSKKLGDKRKPEENKVEDKKSKPEENMVEEKVKNEETNVEKPKKPETQSPKKQSKKEKTDKKTPSTADEKGNVALNLKIECTHDCDKRSDIVLAENEFQDQIMTIPQVSETVSEEKKEEKDSKKEKRDLDQEAPSAKTETPVPGHQELDWRVKVDDAPAPTPVAGYQELDWQVKTKADVPTTTTTTTTTATTSTPTLTSQLPNPPKPPRPVVPKKSKPWFKAEPFADNGMAKTVQKRSRGPGIPCPKNDRRECLKKEREAEERMYNLPERR